MSFKLKELLQNFLTPSAKKLPTVPTLWKGTGSWDDKEVNIPCTLFSTL